MPVPAQNEIAVPTYWDAESIGEDLSPFIGRAVPRSILLRHAPSLPALAPRAFAYFLEDLLIYSLEDPTDELAENLIYWLRNLPVDEPYERERMELLSLEQRRVVADCCEWLETHLHQNEEYLIEAAAEAKQNWRRATQ
jgi:hypothetical protein